MQLLLIFGQLNIDHLIERLVQHEAGLQLVIEARYVGSECNDFLVRG
jgi:hypothetical protein